MARPSNANVSIVYRTWILFGDKVFTRTLACYSEAVQDAERERRLSRWASFGKWGVLVAQHVDVLVRLLHGDGLTW